MKWNTVKTTVGYFLTLFRKYLSFSSAKNKCADAFNYLRISDNLATSGQPTESQLSSIREQGFKTIINLAPHSAENALKDEETIVTGLGMDYIHIPVDFKNPTEADFNTFIVKMQTLANEKVWIHCAANMRVSVFIYKYRCNVLNEDPQKAKIDLNKIWEPTGVWEQFCFGEN